MFFKNHGVIQYNIGNTTYPMTDITKVSVSVNLKNTILQYINVNNRSPEQIANDVYEDPKLYWTILFINDVVDPFIDWYMIEDHLYEYCLRIYGQDKILAIRYFINNRTNEISSENMHQIYLEMLNNGEQLPEDIESVSNYEYEKIKNESKKVIKIIPKTLITKFVEDFKTSLKG